MSKKFNSRIIQDIFLVDSENVYESQLVQQCFDIVGVFISAVDLKGNITLINRMGEKLLGYSRDNIIGKNFIDSFIVEDEKEKIRKLFSELVNDNSSYPERTTFTIRSHEGETRIIEAKNITIQDKNNNILGILISGDDVTDYIRHQQDLKKDLSLYRLLADNIPDINLYLFDTNLRFVLAEGKEMKKYGFQRSDFEGKKLSDLKSKTIRKIWEPMFSEAIQGKEIASEYKYKNYYYLIWILPIKNKKDQITSVIAITQNITEDKLTKQRLRKSKEEAVKANNAKSEFLARVSHEIRTPLNAILGFSEQLKQTSLEDQQAEYVNVIDKSAEHLLSLINDILIISKIEARQINFDSAPFKIAYTVKYIYNTLLVKASEKKLKFTYDIDEKLDIVLLGDAFRLRQILMNMLNNAIKFTHSGYVELRCFLKKETREEVYVRFDVIDTGIGINPENLEAVFEQFKQADSSITKKYGGTGLGLTICKNLIEMQNGSLSVSSQEGLGTTFTFVIPFRKGKETDIIPEDLGSIDSEKLRGKKVLLVDDDSVNRLLGKTILEKLNCSIDIAIHGKEAIEKLDKNKYDILLLDIHMPDISGIDVAKYLRRTKKDSRTKIVAVTAAVMKDDIKNYFKAGIDDFLIKPFKEIYLYNKMCEMLDIETSVKAKSREEIILKEELSPKKYNLDELKRMTGNKRALISKMLNTFIENSEIAIDAFRKHIADKNWEQLGENAHKLLPSYKHLDVQNVIIDLKKIKTKTLIESDYTDLETLVEKVIAEIKSILADLRNEVKKYEEK